MIVINSIKAITRQRLVMTLFIKLVSITVLLCMYSYASALEYISDAEKAIDKEDYKTAIIHLKNQLKQKSDDAYARYLLGTSYLKTGNAKGAKKELEKAYKLDKNSNKIQLAYASVLNLKDDKQLIKSILSKQFQNPSEESERLVILANVAIAENQLADAVELLGTARQLKDTSEVQITLANLALAEKNNSKAEEIIESVLDKDKTNKKAMYVKALILSAKEEYNKTINILNSLLEKDPKNLRYLLDRAGIKLKQKDYKGLEQDIKIVLKQFGNQPTANFLMAMSKLQQEDFQLARQYAQKVLNVLPNHYPSMFVSGLAEFSLGNFNQAEKFISQYLFQFPDNLEAQNILANIYIAKNEGEQALLILESIDQGVIDKNVNMLLSLGTAYLLVGEYDKGISTLNQAKKLSPENQLIDKRLLAGYLKSDNVEEAIKTLEAMAEDKKNKQAQNMLVITYIQKNKLDKAKSAVDKYLSQDPNDPNLYNFQAVLLLLNKNQEQALVSYKKAITIDKNFIPAYLGIVRIHMSNNQFIQAEEVFKQILLINDSYIKAWLGRAAIAEKTGDKDKVEFFIMEGLKRVKGNLGSELIASQQLSRWYINQGQQSKVLELGRDLINRYPNESSAILFQIKALILNNERLKAEPLLAKLVYNEPDNREFQILLAGILIEKKDNDRALTLLNDLLEANPEDNQALLLKGNVLIVTGQYNEARIAIDKYQELDPDAEEGYHLEGELLVAEKKYDSAIKAYKTAFQKSSNNQVLVKIIALYQRQNKTQEAIRYLNQVIIENDANIIARYRLALMLQDMNNYVLAEHQYRAILKHEPENALILNNLAWVLYKQKDSQALMYGQKAYNLKPDSPAVLDTYGYILLNEGRLQEGVKLLEKAANSAPQAKDIQFHLAKGYYLTGEKQKAKEKLADILFSKSEFAEKENAKSLFNKLQ